jgi:hypothetical protein
LILKKFWIYLLVLLVVAGLYGAVTFFSPKENKEIKNHPLFQNLAADRVQEMEWQRGTDVVHLKKETHWQIIRPVSEPADSKAVERILQTLTQLRPERKFAESEKDLKEFGLDHPRLKILFLTQGRWLEIQVGNKTTVGNACYIKTSNSADLFLIDETLVKELDRDLESLREKKVKKGL